MKKIYGGTKMITYKEFGEELLEMVKEIYMQEGWWAYLGDDEKLARAFKNSLYTLGAFEGDRLTGFVRCVGDGEHILLVQDLIIEINASGSACCSYTSARKCAATRSVSMHSSDAASRKLAMASCASSYGSAASS